jgi:hypothetical protein
MKKLYIGMDVHKETNVLALAFFRRAAARALREDLYGSEGV